MKTEHGGKGYKKYLWVRDNNAECRFSGACRPHFRRQKCLMVRQRAISCARSTPERVL